MEESKEETPKTEEKKLPVVEKIPRDVPKEEKQEETPKTEEKKPGDVA